MIGFHGVSGDVEAIQATRKDVRSLPSLLVHCAVECRPSDAPLVARTEAAAAAHTDRDGSCNSRDARKKRQVTGEEEGRSELKVVLIL